MTTRALLRATAAAWLLTLGVLAAPAQAADGIDIGHSEVADDGTVSLLLDVDHLPAGGSPDLDSIEVTVDGKPVEATAAAVKAGQVARTTVLTLDTSDSMRGARIRAGQGGCQVLPRRRAGRCPHRASDLLRQGPRRHRAHHRPGRAGLGDRRDPPHQGHARLRRRGPGREPLRRRRRALGPAAHRRCGHRQRQLARPGGRFGQGARRPPSTWSRSTRAPGTGPCCPGSRPTAAAA